MVNIRTVPPPASERSQSSPRVHPATVRQLTRCRYVSYESASTTDTRLLGLHFVRACTFKVRLSRLRRSLVRAGLHETTPDTVRTSNLPLPYCYRKNPLVRNSLWKRTGEKYLTSQVCIANSPLCTFVLPASGPPSCLRGGGRHCQAVRSRCEVAWHWELGSQSKG